MKPAIYSLSFTITCPVWPHLVVKIPLISSRILRPPGILDHQHGHRSVVVNDRFHDIIHNLSNRMEEISQQVWPENIPCMIM